MREGAGSSPRPAQQLMLLACSVALLLQQQLGAADKPSSTTLPPSVLDPHYDCQLREIARDYTKEVVLGSWAAGRQTEALALVTQALKMKDCITILDGEPLEPVAHMHEAESAGLPADVVKLHVATTGSDSAAGTATAPLRTITGAQAVIRKRFPTVSTRPAIVVMIAPGNYFYGAAPNGHATVRSSTRYSGTAIAHFSAEDSGASASKPIVFASSVPSQPARFFGGLPLRNLSWVPAELGVPGVLKTKIQGTVEVDSQDQLLLFDSASGAEHLLVRGRTPNGKPWIPQDGYNLTVAASHGTLPMAPVYKQCSAVGQTPAPAPNPKRPPRPTTPPVGKCTAAPNVSLLVGYPHIPGVRVAPRLMESAVDCMKFCQNESAGCRRGYTWEYNECFILTDPYMDAWSTAEPFAGQQSGLCTPTAAALDCAEATTHNCVAASVVCASTNVTQVAGSLGVSSAAGRKLAGTSDLISVKHCLKHLLDLANDWPTWYAASYGLSETNCSNPLDCINTMYTEYNYPLWYGPWASDIEINIEENAGVDMSKYTWKDADKIVVHAMADGEWGGTQFKVASATMNAANPVLHFSYGGFQQARGATLGPRTWHSGAAKGNRFYMEGSIEFLDAPGEWHFDPSTRDLYIFPPRGVSLDSITTELVLTQTDTLFEFIGESSDAGSRVEHIIFDSLSFAYTSAQFFRPHEETSGGDYATHRSGAVKIENATGLKFVGNEFSYIGGNGVFLSASVRNVTVTQNLFQWIGTNGVAVQGKTGAAMMDGRDGEAMVAAHGRLADNGVRLPKDNLVSHNVFANYGVWDKQSAAYHKALAPGNVFLNNVCFNSSRHGVSFQDGMGGGGIAEGNVMFNLNRETHDTTALNSWNRRNYVTSDPTDPAVGIIIPPTPNEWRRNLVLGRDYYGIADGNGNAIRNDDGASFYIHSNNVLYAPGNPGVQFNGGVQIQTRHNLYLLTTAAWNLGPTPDSAAVFNDTIVDAPVMFRGSCNGFYTETKAGVLPGIYTGDWNLGVMNSTGHASDLSDNVSHYFCGGSLTKWQLNTSGQDAHSRVCTNANGECESAIWLQRAREMLGIGR